MMAPAIQKKKKRAKWQLKTVKQTNNNKKARDKAKKRGEKRRDEKQNRFVEHQFDWAESSHRVSSEKKEKEEATT